MKSRKLVALTLMLLAAPAANAQTQRLAQLEVNPRVLVPSARDRLPQGGVIVIPPHSAGRWGAAPPWARQAHPPVYIYRNKPFIEDGY